MATSLSSPGVEVREIDASLRVQNNGGTSVFIPGFACQGPVEEITSITSIADFEQIYGVPTNAAERYFYYTVLAVLNNASKSTTVLVSRLPYGSGEGDNVTNALTILAYPAVPIQASTKYDSLKDQPSKIIKAEKNYNLNEKAITDETTGEITGYKVQYSPVPRDPEDPWGRRVIETEIIYIDPEDEHEEKYQVYETIENNITYVLGEPTSFQVSLDEYYKILTDVLFTENNSINGGWSNEPGKISTWEDLNKAAFIVINKSRSVINESLEGFYFGLNDSMFNEPLNLYKSDDKGKQIPITLYNDIKSVKFSNLANAKSDHAACGPDVIGHNYQVINENKLDFELIGSNQGSISKVMQKDMSSYTTENPELDDVLSCALFKFTKSSSGAKALKLNYAVRENYNFSLGESRVTSSTKTNAPVTLYAPNVTKNSNNIVVTVNPYIAKSIKVDIEGNVFGRVRIANEKLLDKLSVISDEIIWNNPKLVKDGKATFINTVIRAGVDYKTLQKILNDPNACASISMNEDATVDWIKPCESLYGFGTYRLDKNANQFIGSVPAKLSRTLMLIENDEEYPDVDIICEGGLGTIYVYSNVGIGATDESEQIISSKDGVIELWGDPSDTEGINDIIIDYSAGDEVPVSSNDGRILECKARNFVDSLVIRGIEDLRSGKSNLNNYATSVKDAYMSVQNIFLGFANTFANGGRGDVFYLPDLLRGIAIKGVDTKIESLYGTALNNDIYDENEKVNHSWATSAYSPIKHLYDSFTSSFAAVYATMFKREDFFTNKFIWVPASGYIAASFAASDTLAGPWLAGAGLNRGIVQGVLDTALNPTLRQRDDLYKISINAVPKIANVGSVIYGIRTMIKKPTSFDQVTCRRTALLLGKTMKKYLRYYVFEPNTSYTRLCMYNDLQPYLESIKAAGGIYNYRLVTDESVNTPEIINNGEMAVACTVQYVRTAEFVTLTMTAEKYASTINVAEA